MGILDAPAPTKAYLDGRYALVPNAAGSRRMVGAVTGWQHVDRQYTYSDSKTQWPILSSCADLHLVYTPGVAGGTGLEGVLTNPIFVKAGYSTDNVTFLPVTFGGRQNGQLDPNGILTSDTIPADVAAGSVLYVTTRISQAFGVSTTLAANVAINDTSCTINALPAITSGYVFVGTGSTGETVNVASITGSGPTYTMTLAPNTKFTKVHSTNDYVGQQLLSIKNVYADLNEGSATATTATATDRSYTGSFGAVSAFTTTVGGSSTTLAGSPTIPLAGTVGGTTIIIGAGGTQETATIVNVTGVANPFTAWLSSPTTFNHAVGETVTSVIANTAQFCPTAIVADRVTAAVLPAVVGVGTSIMAGTGWHISRLYNGYAALAFAGQRVYLPLAIGSEQLSTFVSAGGAAQRRRLLGMGQWLLCNYPTNDFAGGRTLAQVKADIATLVGWCRTRGMKIALETVLPRVTSSDNFATLNGQTLPAWESDRLAYNAWVRAGADGLSNLCVDTAAKVDSGLVSGGAESGKWIVAGSNGSYTLEGTHPSDIGHQLMATAINPALFV